jgi:large subunit ribosomal protein L9
MEVILKEDYLALGYVGDTVKVKRGYARNYLIPRGLAVEASNKNDSALKHKLAGILSKRLKKKTEAESFGKILQQVTVEFTIKVGVQGKSFGSITAKDIEASLQTLGYQVDKRQIRIGEPIKTAGVHAVEVRLHSEVSVDLQVKVTAAAPVASASDSSSKEKKGRKKKVDAVVDETDGDAAIDADESLEESEE